MAKEVARKDSLPAFLAGEDLAKYGGMGVSHEAEDAIVPLLRVLQAQSPQLNAKKSEHVPGASTGDIWLRGTNITWSNGLWLIQCGFEHVWNEWVPRDDGGGFVGRHETRPASAIEVFNDPDKPKQGKRWVSEDKSTEFVETRNHFVLIVPDDTHPEIMDPEPAVLTVSSSGHTFSKNWTTTIKRNKQNGVILPAFSKKYLITTASLSNDQGDWEQYTLTGESEWVSAEEYAAAKEFAELIARGERRADIDDGDTPVSSSQSPTDGEEPPF